MSRRKFARTVAGLILPSYLAINSGNQAQGQESFMYDNGQTQRNGLDIRYVRHRIAKNMVSAPTYRMKDRRLGLLEGVDRRTQRIDLPKGDTAYVALAGNMGEYPYEVGTWCPGNPGNRDSFLELFFNRGTPHGQLNIREPVGIMLHNAAEIYVQNQRNWGNPVINADNSRGDYDISTGNVLINAQGNNIYVDTRAMSPRVIYSATPFALLDRRRLGNNWLIVQRNGRTRTQRI